MDTSPEQMMASKEKVLAILLMRFNLKPSKGISIVQKWFTEHPTATWETLENLFNQNQVTFVEGTLRNVSPSVTSETPTNKYRGAEYSKLLEPWQRFQENSSWAVNRQYRGVKY